MARILLDRARCSGLGICESLAEHVFEIQDDGSLALLIEEVDGDDLEPVRQACASCPTAALRLEE